MAYPIVDSGQAGPSDCDPVTLPSDIWRVGFCEAVAAGVTSSPARNALLDLLVTGSGQTVAQTGGNLTLTSGTTINSETIIRSKRTFRGAHLARWKATLSQRIVNQTFTVELADLIGDNLSYTITNATTVVITVPVGPDALPRYSASHVGMTFTLGNIRDTTGAILLTAPPQDCVIAGTSGNTVTVTVAGFPASGSGTLMAYGMNTYRAAYDGATATNMKWEPRRRGYQQTAATFTCTTTASPGHIIESRTDCTNASLHDTSYTTTATSVLTSRSVRLDNLPDDDGDLYLFIRSTNGTVAPASTTTFTLGFAGVELPGNGKVTMLSPQADAQLSQITGSVTVIQGTGSSLNAQVTGSAAHSAAGSGNPARVAGLVVPTTVATIDSTLVAGDVSNIGMTTGYQAIVKPYGTAELDWGAVSSIVPTVWASAATPVQVRAASGTALMRTYVSNLSLSADVLSAATSLWLVDGAVAISSATVATPGVITSGTHDFKIGDAIVLQGITGLALAGVSANQVIYVATVPSATTFTVALTPGGTGVQCTVTGTATAYRILHQIRLQATTLPATPIQLPTPIRTAPNVALSLLCSATATGTAFMNSQGYYGI